MRSGFSDELVFRFYCLATVDDSGRPYAEAVTDPEAFQPDGFLTKRWNVISQPGIGVLPIEFEIRLDRSELEIECVENLAVVVKKQLSNPRADLNNSEIVIDAIVEEKPAWDDKSDWEEDNKQIPPSRFSDVEKEIEDPKFDDEDFEEAFGSEKADGPFATYVEKMRKQPRDYEAVRETLHSENIQADDEIRLSVVGSDGEE